MAIIREFLVKEPYPSKAVEGKLIDALRHGGVFDVVLTPIQDVPPPEDMSLSFKIRQATYPTEGGMVISGDTVENFSITIRTSKDLERVATASMVSVDPNPSSNPPERGEQ